MGTEGAIGADAELLGRVRSLDAGAVDLGALAPGELSAASLLVIGGSDAWARLRAWRAGGLRAAVVVIGPPDPPDRGALEPVERLETADAAELARVRDRLAARAIASTVALAGGTADLHRATFRRSDGVVARLTGLEVRLLGYLAGRPARAVGREELQEQVWEHRAPLPTRTVEVTVLRLRKKIELDPSHPVTLLTVRGEGYRVALAGPDDPRDPRGRSALLAELASRLDRPTVLALHGPAGVGKSRVLDALARRVPVARVDLDGVGAEPWTALATGLGVPLPADGEARASVLEGLRSLGKRGLLVDHADAHLDALEAVAGALIEDGVSVVVAARRRPGWEGCLAREVGPLATEDGVALLAERAGTPVDGLAPVVERLDGLPLAIELAAPRLAALGPAALLAALEAHGTSWLSRGGTRGSLREAVDAALDALPPGPRRRLAGLAELAGPFDAALAEAIVGATPLDLVAWVDEGLVVRAEDGFRLLRAAAEALVERDPAAVGAAREARSRAIGLRARAAVDALEGATPRAALERLRRLVPDLRALVAGPPSPDADRVAAVAGLERVLAQHGTPRERRALLDPWIAALEGRLDLAGDLLARRIGLDFHGDRDAALARLDAATEAARSVAPEVAARLALQGATYAYAHAGPEQVLDRLERLEVDRLAPRDAAHARALAVRARARRGDIGGEEQVRELGGLVDALLEEGALPRAVDVTLRMADVLLAEDPVRAERALARVADRVEDLVERPVMASVLVWRAQALGELGHTERALEFLARAEAWIATVDPVRVLLVTHIRGRVLAAAGRYAEARADLEHCRDWWTRHGWTAGVYDQLEQLAIVELCAGLIGEGARRAQEAREIAEKLGEPSRSEASVWVACAAALDGRPDAARAALAGTRPELLPSDRRAIWTLCASAPSDDVDARVDALLARVPDPHPVRRLAVRLRRARA